MGNLGVILSGAQLGTHRVGTKELVPRSDDDIGRRSLDKLRDDTLWVSDQGRNRRCTFNLVEQVRLSPLAYACDLVVEWTRTV